MKLYNCSKQHFYTYDDNDLDAHNPQWWAEEALIELEENLVYAQTVNRDYDNVFARAGETVNLRRPNRMQGKRVADGGELSPQAISSTPVAVKLNQHLEASFNVHDRELQRSLSDVRQEFLVPAVRSIALQAERILAAKAFNSYLNVANKVGSAVNYAAVVNANKVMRQNNVPMQERRLIVGPEAEASLLNEDKLIKINNMGETPSPILTGQIGRASGFDVLTTQVQSEVLESDIEITTEATSATADPGAKQVAVASMDIDEGQWLMIAGDMTPQRCTETISSGTTLKFEPGLRSSVESSATVYVYESGTIDNSYDDYPIGYDQGIKITGLTKFPQVGQGVSFNEDSRPYVIIAVDETDNKIWLDDPLEAKLEDGDEVNLMPHGNWNLGLIPDFMTLVNRPLELPTAANMNAAIASYNNLAIRVMMSYDHKKLSYLVSVDFLMGSKILNPDMAVLLLG